MTRPVAAYRRAALRSGAVLAILAMVAAVLLPTGAAAATAGVPARGKITQLCPRVPGRMVCLAERTPASGPAVVHASTAGRMRPMDAGYYAYGPDALRDAYRIPASTTTATVAVVGAFDAPEVESDLATYRSAFGLPACTSSTGCFRKVNQAGGSAPLPAADGDWAGETTLDVEMVSAICPSCHIMLVEANTDDRYGAPDMEQAVRTATSLGARYVSMSWGGDEISAERSLDGYLNKQGVAYVAASGDYGYGTSWPAANPNVVSVGGTTLLPASNTRGWTETVWSDPADQVGTGSGCSRYEPRPVWQTIAPITSLCSRRAMNDVAVVGDPFTGVVVYQDGDWWLYGGTSAGAPMVAAMYALAGTPSTDPASFYAYAHRSAFNDVTTSPAASCSSALCKGAAGWDGPTGVGTPNGVSGFKAPNTIKVHNPGSVAGHLGTSATVNTTAVDSGHLAVSYIASGLPSGIAMRSSGYLAGTPRRAGSYSVTVTGRDATGGFGRTTFRWTITPHKLITRVAPRITGVAMRGHKLTAHWASFHADQITGAVVHPAIHIQWYVNGKPIKGATHATFKVRAAYKGRRISMRLTASRTYFTTYVHVTPRTRSVR